MKRWSTLLLFLVLALAPKAMADEEEVVDVKEEQQQLSCTDLTEEATNSDEGSGFKVRLEEKKTEYIVYHN